MAASNKDRPNLKICIDNSEPNSDVGASSSDEDEVVIHTHFDEDSSMEEDGDRASDSEERARREAVVRVTASSFKTKGEARLLSSIPAFKKSTDAKVKKTLVIQKVRFIYLYKFIKISGNLNAKRTHCQLQVTHTAQPVNWNLVGMGLAC